MAEKLEGLIDVATCSNCGRVWTPEPRAADPNLCPRCGETSFTTIVTSDEQKRRLRAGRPQ